MITDTVGYIPLIENFLEKKISPKKFDESFWEILGNDEYMYSEQGKEDFFHLIDELCYFVDSYVDDETLKGGEDLEPFERGENDIDEVQLRAEVARIYLKIKELE